MALQLRRVLEKRGLTIDVEADTASDLPGTTPGTQPDRHGAEEDSEDDVLSFFQPPPEAVAQANADRKRKEEGAPKMSNIPTANEALHALTGIDRHSGIGRQRSALLHPDYPLMQMFTAVSTILLVYVAIVVQVEVGFFWHESLCAPRNMALMKFDVFLDCFFLLEIVLKFFTGVWIEGHYHDEMLVVAKQYAASGLWFDIITSVPVTILEYVARLQLCVAEVNGEKPEHIRGGRLVRALKPLRVFKMLKLMRAGTVMVLLEKVERWVRMPVFVSRMLRAAMVIFFVVHTCSCVFWLVKESSNSEQELDDFLMRYDVDPNTDLLLEKYSLAFYFGTST